ncbi:hypothetical protein [Bradyrhizobium sp. NAS96.2]|uniref:hypothetical protein n=1 Tax=Bradyrhizobium sp. NAS96.2 TaxID=1680160 RepID=UPI0011614E74|nr:hypothetical protein [Bradyrhizobium sp. NAS96.2]
MSATNIQNVVFMLMIARLHHLTEPTDQLHQGAGSARISDVEDSRSRVAMNTQGEILAAVDADCLIM